MRSTGSTALFVLHSRPPKSYPAQSMLKRALRAFSRKQSMTPKVPCTKCLRYVKPREPSANVRMTMLCFNLQMQPCAIGVSKKCCYMCYLLGEYMFGNTPGKLCPSSKHLPTNSAETGRCSKELVSPRQPWSHIPMGSSFLRYY